MPIRIDLNEQEINVLARRLVSGRHDWRAAAQMLKLQGYDPDEVEVTRKRNPRIGDLRKSYRLQKFFRFLYQRSLHPPKHGKPGATGGAIIWRTRTVGVSTAAWELRQPENASFKIKNVEEGRTKHGGHITRYTLDINFTQKQRARLDWLLGPRR